MIDVLNLGSTVPVPKSIHHVSVKRTITPILQVLRQIQFTETRALPFDRKLFLLSELQASQSFWPLLQLARQSDTSRQGFFQGTLWFFFQDVFLFCICCQLDLPSIFSLPLHNLVLCFARAAVVESTTISADCLHLGWRTLRAFDEKHAVRLRTTKFLRSQGPKHFVNFFFVVQVLPVAMESRYPFQLLIRCDLPGPGRKKFLFLFFFARCFVFIR